MTFCSNYWIKKCKALEKQGEICQNDRIKTEAEFQAWLNGTADAYKGISCLLSLRSEQKFVPKNTENDSETSYELIDPEYFASFTPQLMDRIRKDAEEVSKAFQMPPPHAMNVCSNYWTKKCKALESQGEICQNDRAKTEAEFQAWLIDLNDLYKGISCLQSLRWGREQIRKKPNLYLHAD